LYLILLGLPGAGKGTQAALLSEATGMAHITSGGLFRENISNQTELGRQVSCWASREPERALRLP